MLRLQMADALDALPYLAMRRQQQQQQQQQQPSAPAAPAAADEQIASHVQASKLAAWQAALSQPAGVPVPLAAQAVLLFAVQRGHFDHRMGDAGAVALLHGGAEAPLVRHVRGVATDVYEAISQEGDLTETAARQLDVAVRLVLALQDSGALAAENDAPGATSVGGAL